MRKLVDKLFLAIASLICILIIMWGFTYLLVRVVRYTNEHLPIFQDEQRMAGVFIWCYMFITLIGIFKRKNNAD